MIYWIIGIIIIAALILLALTYLLDPFKKQNLNKTYYYQAWREIIALLNDPAQHSMAIIKADKLLDRALKESGFRGQTAGERLAKAGDYFADKEAVWRVHKLRNKLVHEVDFELDQRQTKAVLRIFGQALEDLGAI